MAALERMAPIWPAANMNATQAFWERLGFVSRRYDQGYLLLWRDPAAELHFYPDDGGPTWPDRAAFLRVPDVDAWHRAFSAAGLPAEGVPRLTPVEDKPWGVREFALVDLNGHLLRVGTPLADALSQSPKLLASAAFVEDASCCEV